MWWWRGTSTRLWAGVPVIRGISDAGYAANFCQITTAEQKLYSGVCPQGASAFGDPLGDPKLRSSQYSLACQLGTT